MALNLEKLQHLWRTWKRQCDQLADSSTLLRRVDELYGIAMQWEEMATSPNAIPGLRSAHDEGIPANPWNSARQNLLNVYDRVPELAALCDQVAQIETVLHVTNRQSGLRIASNLSPDQSEESWNTTPTPANPESYVASYNYPFQIIRYFRACLESNEPAEPLQYANSGRFLPLYLWMLARRDTVVPILSVASLGNLVPILQQINKRVWQGLDGSRWSMPLPEFAALWPSTSAELSQQITGTEYTALDPAHRLLLVKLLFHASLEETTSKNAFDMLQASKAIILYGPPGTGKTHQAQELVRQLLKLPRRIGREPDPNLLACRFSRLYPTTSTARRAEAETTNPPPLPETVPGAWELIQFHPSYSYQDFIGGIMPDVSGGQLRYALHEGIFKRFCDAAVANRPKPFVLIIDEINRADLSSVFGELMYAIEYRGRKLNIPHFEEFEIPENVYVIGTMNSADKSLVTFDLALRRRFLFVKLEPNLRELHQWHVGESPQIAEEDLVLLIDKAVELNRAIVGRKEAHHLGLPKDYEIGEAYFTKIRHFCISHINEDGTTELRITEFAREQLWEHYLQPLLDEYLGAVAEEKAEDLKQLRDAFVQTPH